MNNKNQEEVIVNGISAFESKEKKDRILNINECKLARRKSLYLEMNGRSMLFEIGFHVLK